MVKSIAEMTAKGTRKLIAKVPTMKANYDAAKGRMKTAYGLLPFNSRMKAAYNAGVDAAQYTAPDPAKWATNWAAKVS